ncbi:LuxR C-terminal-related transcriptional regulator [Williamsia soli]|uniref:LuxR C-terminal-related transcriptional regulator n=1 Tax=Williamsia soli TaxID=364929 RepID=UPI001F45414B|nr:LuxR C-terminal-related transcriptional regulator [Williamsia soli]
MYTMDEAPQATRPTLSEREVEVLRTWLICDTKEEAGRALFIGAATVSTHIARVRGKYDAAGRPANTKAALLARALQDGLITVDEL